MRYLFDSNEVEEALIDYINKSRLAGKKVRDNVVLSILTISDDGDTYPEHDDLSSKFIELCVLDEEADDD